MSLLNKVKKGTEGFILMAAFTAARAVDAFAGDTNVDWLTSNNGGSFEVPERLVNASRLHNAAVFGNVAEQHSQAAVFRVGVLNVANAAVGAVGVERRPSG